MLTIFFAAMIGATAANNFGLSMDGDHPLALQVERLARELVRRLPWCADDDSVADEQIAPLHLLRRRVDDGRIRQVEVFRRHRRLHTEQADDEPVRDFAECLHDGVPY